MYRKLIYNVSSELRGCGLTVMWLNGRPSASFSVQKRTIPRMADFIAGFICLLLCVYDNCLLRFYVSKC